MATNTEIIAIIKGQEADVAEVRYNVAKKMQALITASRMAGREYMWIVERA